MSMSLFNWYPPSVPVYKAKLLRKSGGGWDSTETYPIGTEVLAVIDDPERPSMADVQMPNGNLIRFMRNEVEILEKVR